MYSCEKITNYLHQSLTFLLESTNKTVIPMWQAHVRNNSNAGLLTHTISSKIALRFQVLPSQFPNDRLSPTNLKTFGAHSDSYRSGFSPDSLFTNNTQTALLTHCVTIQL